jgi:hypothetical protein
MYESDDRRHLRVLIANEKRERLELLAQVVTGLGHEVIARETYVKDVGAATDRSVLEGPANRDFMEAGGIEPPSAVAPGRASTSLACALISPGRPVRRRPTAGPAILQSHPSGDWLSFGASPLSDAAYPNHGPSSERRTT